MDALSKVSLLEARVEEREKEIESLLQSNNGQRTSTVQVLKSLLETERAAQAEANGRTVALSLQLQSTQGKLDLLQQELTSVCLNETALDSKLKTASHGKRSRVDDYDVGLEAIQDMDVDGGIIRGRKRFKSTTLSAFKGDEDNNHSQQTESEDHSRFTVLKLKQELTKHGYGAELLKLRNPNKKDILSLYEIHILQK